MACTERQKRTVQALGLKHVGESRELKDNPATRGMIFVVQHMLEVTKK
ncbi:MAG: 50S ribosomal protein L30 [Firmicutes bacterium]|nr:50S ribosomal protein L30 [Bacillota bacterium]